VWPILHEQSVASIFAVMKLEEGSQPPSAAGAAKPARSRYKRYLPHIQYRDKTVYVTFSTRQRWKLPETVRDAVLKHCLHDHGTKLHMHAAVVMPDHVHLLFQPLRDAAGGTYGLAEIMSGIKGSSAHTVNRMLSRKGHVWEAESFDRLLRSTEQARAVAEYICANPFRAALAKDEDDYPWLWREWIEGIGE
jgi:REP element-mobilizing transposase RayT